MSDPSIAKALGKIIIAAAWADGEFQVEEKEILKDILYQLPELPAADMRELESLMEEPVGATEREVFLIEFTNSLKHQRDKDFALYALDRMVHADGVVTKAEEDLVVFMKEAIETKSTRSMGKVEELLKTPLVKKNKTSPEYPVDNFVHQQLAAFKKGSQKISLDEPQLKKLALAGFLMARVVRADNRIKDQEVDLLVDFLQETWDLKKKEAQFVIRICLSNEGREVDLIRACRVFYELTNEHERVAFLDILFKVAMSDDVLTDDEIQEVINISANLKLEHNYFHKALSKNVEESGLMG